MLKTTFSEVFWGICTDWWCIFNQFLLWSSLSIFQLRCSIHSILSARFSLQSNDDYIPQILVTCQSTFLNFTRKFPGWVHHWPIIINFIIMINRQFITKFLLCNKSDFIFFLAHEVPTSVYGAVIKMNQYITTLEQLLKS